MRWVRETVVVVLAGTAACAPRAPSLATLADSASYAVGMNMGSQLRQVKDEIALDALVAGLRDMVEGDTTKLTEATAMQVLQQFAAQVQQRQAEGRTAMADSNVKVGDAYRAENGKRNGVQTTASGLQYEVLTAGNGKPAASDRVRTIGHADRRQGIDSRIAGQPDVRRAGIADDRSLQLMLAGNTPW
jgi:hypothetical protein